MTFAEEEKRILITNDKDFGELIFRLKKPAFGVILLRLKSDLLKERNFYLINTINTLKDKFKSNFIVVAEKKVRIRKLI